MDFNDQPFASEARKGLVDLVFGKTVTFEVGGRGEDGLEISNLHAGGRFVNAEMVKAGLAWRYEQHDQQNDFGSLEEEARTNQRGLWVDAHPVPPWEWREKRAVR
jgi:hypothetical protein